MVRQDSETGISHVSVALVTKFQSQDCIPHMMKSYVRETHNIYMISSLSHWLNCAAVQLTKFPVRQGCLLALDVSNLNQSMLGSHNFVVLYKHMTPVKTTMVVIFLFHWPYIEVRLIP